MNGKDTTKILIVGIVAILLLSFAYVYGIKNTGVSRTGSPEDNSDVEPDVTDSGSDVETIPETDKDEPLNSNFSLRLGQTRSIDGLNIKALRVLEDSRCPKDVQCIWAGRAAITFEVTSGVNKGEITLYSDAQEPIVFYGYSIRMIDISPARISSSAPEAGDYLLTLNVKKD